MVVTAVRTASGYLKLIAWKAKKSISFTTIDDDTIVGGPISDTDDDSSGQFQEAEPLPLPVPIPPVPQPVVRVGPVGPVGPVDPVSPRALTRSPIRPSGISKVVPAAPRIRGR